MKTHAKQQPHQGNQVKKAPPPQPIKKFKLETKKQLGIMFTLSLWLDASLKVCIFAVLNLIFTNLVFIMKFKYQIVRWRPLITAVAVKVLTSPRTGVTSVMFNLVRRAASILTSSWA
jgi:hypothetical protein